MRKTTVQVVVTVMAHLVGMKVEVGVGVKFMMAQVDVRILTSSSYDTITKRLRKVKLQYISRVDHWG